MNSQVTLVNTMSGEVLNEAGVLNKFGVPPDRIVDYLMLVGDTVDNVPGVTRSAPRRRPSGFPSTVRSTS